MQESIMWSLSPGPCLTTAIWRCRKPFSQWQCSFQRKLHSHCLKFLRQRHLCVRSGRSTVWFVLEIWCHLCIVNVEPQSNFWHKTRNEVCCLHSRKWYVTKPRLEIVDSTPNKHRGSGTVTPGQDNHECPIIISLLILRSGDTGQSLLVGTSRLSSVTTLS